MSRPFVLIILDGFGVREATPDNAIAQAHTPCLDELYRHCPHGLISGSGVDVGLPAGQMGNSEVGHVTLGAGRVVYQDLTRIDQAIESGDFAANPVFLNLIQQTQQTKGTLHVMSLLSPGGVHSFEAHTLAFLQLCQKQGVKQVMVHAFLDGRDVPPQSALPSLTKIDSFLREQGLGQIATLIGRYYAMDRDARWERTSQAYHLLTKNQGERCTPDIQTALTQAYSLGETDEFVKATCLEGGKPIQAGDGVIFMNFRSDRARQLTHAFVDEVFTAFDRGPRLPLAGFVTLTQYEAGLPVAVAYPPQDLHNGLGEVLSQHHLPQLRIAETEKYAHVTFFFNGGQEMPFPLEDRILIPSPNVATYDLQPEMSALLVTEKLVEAILSQRYAAIICNFANADMVGHTGHFEATVRAIETLDHCLATLLEALRKVGGEALITADHGNAEKMHDHHTHQPHTAHTTDPVPLIYVGHPATLLQQEGVLSDIAPTMLSLMGLPIPSEMTGRVLIQKQG